VVQQQLIWKSEWCRMMGAGRRRVSLISVKQSDVSAEPNFCPEILLHHKLWDYDDEEVDETTGSQENSSSSDERERDIVAFGMRHADCSLPGNGIKDWWLKFMSESDACSISRWIINQQSWFPIRYKSLPPICSNICIACCKQTETVTAAFAQHNEMRYFVHPFITCTLSAETHTGTNSWM
jgi:hypothetical protein